ncbi:hypothetical protein KJ636_03930 [Patescibacteria group bacterium]|nr:hypothetical protein [Patescibacteria group bacterium]
MSKDIKKKILFIVIFVVLGLAVSQIHLSPIIGAKGQAFTPLEFFGPTSGMFLGSLPGAVSVFFVKLFNAIFSEQQFNLTNIIRLFPMVFAAIYFGLSKSKNFNKLILLIPIIAISLFIAHPEGRQVWFYSLYWLIPIIAFFKKDRLILNALGSTFTAHAMGSVAFLYAFNLSAPIWLGLIPIVFVERVSFAIGIWATYLLLNSVLDILVTKLEITALEPLVNPKYTFSKNFFRLNA